MKLSSCQNSSSSSVVESREVEHKRSREHIQIHHHHHHQPIYFDPSEHTDRELLWDQVRFAGTDSDDIEQTL